MSSHRERITSFVASILLCTCLACSLSLIAQDFAKPLEDSRRFNIQKTANSRLVEPAAEHTDERYAKHLAHQSQAFDRRRSIESYFAKPSSVRLTAQTTATVGRNEQNWQGREHVLFSIILLFGTSALILVIVIAAGLVLAERSKRHNRLLHAGDCDIDDDLLPYDARNPEPSDRPTTLREGALIHLQGATASRK